MVHEITIEETSHFLPRKFRWYTLGVLIFLLGLGIVVVISGRFNFLLLAVGECALYFIYQSRWKKHRSVPDPIEGLSEDRKPFSFGRYVILAWFYAMIMEFCVDFGAYNTVNPGIILIIMAGLTPHYFFLAAVFRLWFRWYTYTPREAYFAMGIIGFLLESIILKLGVGTFKLSGMLLFPIDLPVHILNYGGFVLIPTLLHNQTENRPPMKSKMKYLAAILGTLALTLPEIAATYWLVYRVILKSDGN